MPAQDPFVSDAVRAFTDFMSDAFTAEQIADGVAAIEAATVQMSAVGRLTIAVLGLEVKLEITSGEGRAFKGEGTLLSRSGQLEIGGTVSTADADRLFSKTATFTMKGDGTRLYFYDDRLSLLGHFAGSTSGKPFWSSPAVGAGVWFSVG